MSLVANEIDTLIASEANDLTLDGKLKALAQTDPNLFKVSDGAWALKLYDRSVYIFGDFILDHLNPQRSETVEALLKHAEADDHDEFFSRLYRWVYTPQRWDNDVRHLVETAPHYPTIMRGITLRKQDWNARPTIARYLLTSLYRYDTAAYVQNFSYGDNHYFKLPDSDMYGFRQEVAQRDPNFARVLFQRYATQQEWHDLIRRLIAEAPDKIAERLESWHPNSAAPELPPNLHEALVKKFGKAVDPYLKKHSYSVIRNNIEHMIASEPDNVVLLNQLNQLSWDSRQALNSAQDIWVPALYQRDPTLFQSFILMNLPRRTASYGRTYLLEQTLLDGRYDFYRLAYALYQDSADWNTHLGGIIAMNPDLTTLLHELDRFDIAREERWGVTLQIDEANAAALYRLGKSEVKEFIWRYLPGDGRGYSDLLRAIEEAGDMEFFRRVFRKVASSSAWEQDMRALLAQDVPPDQIMSELEQRKPTNIKGVSPAILASFMEKYGEAVLPFFEQYIDWVTPRRLQALFALDIDRAELLRELQAISRRQPREFAQRADLWVIPLYERSPEFFATFISRHVNRWESRNFAATFLPRVEAEGPDQLFRDLYTAFYMGRDWDQDIARILRSGLDDAALEKALDRRTSAWQALPDDLATELYQHNPDRFRNYILEHVRFNRWERRSYAKLQKAAEQRGDTAMRDEIELKMSPQIVIKRQIEALIARNLPADELMRELGQIKKSDLVQYRDEKLSISLLERYGDAVAPFVIDLWRGANNENIRQALLKNASKSSYWRFIFTMNRWHKWDKYWREALQELAKTASSEDAFRASVNQMLPGEQFGEIDEKTALDLYRRFPSASRPLLERFMSAASTELFKLAEKNGDHDFIDYLTYRILLAINPLLYRAYPEPNTRFPRPADQGARKQIEDMTALVTKHFEELYRESPQTYVGHAAQVLSYINPFELSNWWRRSNSKENTVLELLTGQHADDWKRSPEGITSLLESPNIFVQISAFRLLEGGGTDAAARVVENLPVFRAFLMSRAHKKAKWQALERLEAAARDDAGAAERVLPILREAMDYVGKRSVGEDIMVAVAKVSGEAHAN